jgi:asparagine synthase (glutamine-hydrolysing)
MGAAAPHRGRLVESFAHGRCALGCVNDEIGDAGLAVANGFAAVFTGTLDNLSDVVFELERDHEPPRVPTAAWAVAAGFGAWGEQLPGRLRGLFAAILTDGNRLFCFRDHVGFGSLFYRSDVRGFYAATEAKQVVAGAGIDREPDLEAIEGTFFDRDDEETRCAVRGVRRLPRSTLLVVDANRIRSSRYWDPESLLETARPTDAELQERFDELMDRAASRCLTGSDAIFLSGGIDSPAIAAFAAPRHLEISGRPLVAVSAVYPRLPSVDERRYTEIAAAHVGIPLHTWEPQANGLDDLMNWVAVADGPIPAGSLAMYAESYALARQLGHRTILTGEFAEFTCALDGFLIDHLLAHGRAGALGRQLAKRRSRGASWTSLGRQLTAALAPVALHAARLRQNRVGVPGWVDVRKAREAAADSLVGPRRRWAKLQISPLLAVTASLEAEEVCQAVCGVRARRPWSDVDLWEFFLSLPAEVKFPGTRSKSLLRRLLRPRLPAEILDRRDKTVFDESMLANIDYSTLRRLLVDPEHRIGGVDYELLGEHLRRQDLDIVDYTWAMKLAAIHAFLSVGDRQPDLVGVAHD